MMAGMDGGVISKYYVVAALLVYLVEDLAVNSTVDGFVCHEKAFKSVLESNNHNSMNSHLL